MTSDLEKFWRDKFELYSKERQSDKYATDCYNDYSFKRKFDRMMSGLNIKKGDLVLDLGCGPGLMAKRLISEGGDVVCVDYSVGMVLRARKKLGDGMFIIADARNLPFKKNIFDLIICAEIFQYISKPAEVIKQMAYSLKRNGRIRICFPSKKYIRYKLRITKGKSDVKIHHPDEIASYLRENKLSVTRFEDVTVISEKIDKLLDRFPMRGFLSRESFIESVKQW